MVKRNRRMRSQPYSKVRTATDAHHSTSFDPAPFFNTKTPTSPAPEVKKHAIDAASEQVRQEIHNIDVAVNRIESAACKVHGAPQGTGNPTEVRAEPSSLMGCLGELDRVVFSLHAAISRLEGQN